MEIQAQFTTPEKRNKKNSKNNKTAKIIRSNSIYF